jgi:hypothetical protein
MRLEIDACLTRICTSAHRSGRGQPTFAAASPSAVPRGPDLFVAHLARPVDAAAVSGAVFLAATA